MFPGFLRNLLKGFLWKLFAGILLELFKGLFRKLLLEFLRELLLGLLYEFFYSGIPSDAHGMEVFLEFITEHRQGLHLLSSLLDPFRNFIRDLFRDSIKNPPGVPPMIYLRICLGILRLLLKPLPGILHKLPPVVFLGFFSGF